MEPAAIAIHHEESPKTWDEGDVRFVMRLAGHVSRARRHVTRWRRLQREGELATGLLRFAQALAMVRDTQAACELAVAVGAPLAGGRRSALLRENENGGYSSVATSGFPGALLPASLLSLEARLDQAMRARVPVRVDGFEADSVTLVPMFCGREPMGILLCESPSLDLSAAQIVADLVAATLRSAGALESLSSSEAGWSVLFESGPDLCLLIDDHGGIREANSAASRHLGFSRSELAELRFESLLAGESVTRWRDMERELFRTGRLQDVALKLRPKEGGAFDVLVNAAVPLSAPAPPRRARLLLRDVSEITRLELQLRRSQKLEVIGALAGGIAHDFNNVLGGILGYASLLRAQFKDRNVATKYVETIERSALRGAELSGKLLSASRDVPTRRAPVSLNLLVEETLDLLEHSFDKRIRIEKRLDAKLRSVMADASQLQQIVLNLCVNARDAMPEGGVLRVRTRLLEEGVAGGSVLLSVQDDGVGMDSETLARLFEPFFSTKGSAGTGLGLSIVYGIVKSLGGDVGVKSSPGGGARFDVVLPCQWAGEADRSGDTGEAVPGRGELILIVDDERVLRDLAKDILESHGYRVAAVASGEEALHFLEESGEKVALVILDVVMPGLGGAETLRRLRGFQRSLPVLLSSGLAAEPNVQQILEEGASGFIPKPYGIGELTRAVEVALRPKNPTFVH
jgi:PAS domain S-box-containing protein